MRTIYLYIITGMLLLVALPTQATPEALLRELDQMNARARQLNEHLVVQEKRLTSLAARYQC